MRAASTASGWALEVGRLATVLEKSLRISRVLIPASVSRLEALSPDQTLSVLCP